MEKFTSDNQDCWRNTRSLSSEKIKVIEPFSLESLVMRSGGTLHAIPLNLLTSEDSRSTLCAWAFCLCLDNFRDQETIGFLDSLFTFWEALLLHLYHMSKYTFLWFISIAYSLLFGAMPNRHNMTCASHDSTSDQLKSCFLWGMHSWGPCIFKIHENWG